MTSQAVQELPGRTIGRNRIADRHDGAESESSGSVCPKAASQMTIRLIFILNIVELIGRGLPDFHEGICMPVQVLFDFTRIDALAAADDPILDPCDDAVARIPPSITKL